MVCYSHTGKAATMKTDLETNSELWMDKYTPDAIRLQQVHGLLKAIKEEDYEQILKLYYKSQHQHTLNPKDKPLQIPVFIYRDQLQRTWNRALDNAFKSINEATPGINLYETKDINISQIHIGVHKSGKSNAAWTMHGSIKDTLKFPGKSKPFIHLGQKWNKNARYGTSIHELMHALNFDHEMQRFDADIYLEIDEDVDHNYQKTTNKVLTRFDPFSVMMYPLIKMEEKDGDPIWKLKDDGNQCQELSELNKVALNLVYQPCINKSKNFSPQLSIQTGMLYCGRPVMKTHNQVGKGTTDGFCGPNNWANCAACRVVTRIKDKDNKSKQIPKLEACLQQGKWQGLSGLFYCGKQDAKFATGLKFVKSDRKCGPDNGLPCNDCGKELFNDYGIDFFDI